MGALALVAGKHDAALVGGSIPPASAYGTDGTEGMDRIDMAKVVAWLIVYCVLLGLGFRDGGAATDYGPAATPTMTDAVGTLPPAPTLTAIAQEARWRVWLPVVRSGG